MSNTDGSEDPSWCSAGEPLSTEPLPFGWENEMRKERERLLCISSPSWADHILKRYTATARKQPQQSWCLLSDMAASKTGGYVQVSSNGANKFCTLGELLLWTRGINLAKSQQVSHLCHEPLCMVPAHVTAESEVENQNRKGCIVWVDCGHDKSCTIKVSACPHDPKCIKFCSGYATHSEFLSSGIH
jgi:hypothetical protein